MSINNTSSKYSSDTSFGQGELAEYSPHLTVRSVSRPNARSNRALCWKTGRVHHFLSDNEYRYYLYLVWANDVVDIREQFPLKLAQTEEIARSFGVRYPRHKNGNTIMTTDFVITTIDGRVLARTFKDTKSLSKKRNLEKLSIEKEYWESKGVSWGIVHEKMIDRIFADNISTFLECRDFISRNCIPAEIVEILIQAIKGSDLMLTDVCERMDTELDFEVGTSLKIFSCLVANKLIKVDMFKQFSAFIHCSEIVFCEGHLDSN